MSLFTIVWYTLFISKFVFIFESWKRVQKTCKFSFDSTHNEMTSKISILWNLIFHIVNNKFCNESIFFRMRWYCSWWCPGVIKRTKKQWKICKVQGLTRDKKSCNCRNCHFSKSRTFSLIFCVNTHISTHVRSCNTVLLEIGFRNHTENRFFFNETDLIWHSDMDRKKIKILLLFLHLVVFYISK